MRKISLDEDNSRCSYNQEGADLNITNFPPESRNYPLGHIITMPSAPWQQHPFRLFRILSLQNRNFTPPCTNRGIPGMTPLRRSTMNVSSAIFLIVKKSVGANRSSLLRR
jgi:hypothetical protein